MARGGRLFLVAIGIALLGPAALVVWLLAPAPPSAEETASVPRVRAPARELPPVVVHDIPRADPAVVATPGAAPSIAPAPAKPAAPEPGRGPRPATVLPEGILRPGLQPGEAPPDRLLAGWDGQAERTDSADGRADLAVTDVPEAADPGTGKRPAARTPRASGFVARAGDMPRWDERIGGAAPRSEAEEAALVAAHGLRGDYYDVLVGDLFHVPALEGAPPSFTRVDPAVDFPSDASFALPFEPETFAVRWTGFLDAPAAGTWTFTCGSDDGARLLLDGKPVLDHARLRPYGESAGKVELEAGSHSLELVFYENRVFASCRLFWEGPGTPRAPVPPEAFRPPESLRGEVQPHVTGIEPPEARVGEWVRVRGTGLAADPRRLRATFAGAAATEVEADEGGLRVRVPVGASTGWVVVQSGVLSSLPEPFRVKNLQGLYGEYFLMDGEIDAMPDLRGRSPYFVRLDGPVDFPQDDAWNLPFEPDVYAARLTGSLYVAEEDDYRITLGSDDGGRLTIDGRVAVDMPGLHPYVEGTKAFRLQAGFHPIEILFFENRGVAALRLLWQRRGEPAPSPVPAGCLYPPEAVAALPEPVVASLSPDEADPGEEVEILGSGFGADAGLVRVLFPGDVPVRASAAADDRVRARVPRGCGSGDLRVQVGVRSSRALAFRRKSPVGLTGDYFRLADGAVDPAALAARTPDFTRVDGDLVFPTTASWELPFPTSRFAVRWRGTISTEYPRDLLWLLQTDDGGSFAIDGRNVVADPPSHALREVGGFHRLSPGDHPVEIWYVQDGGEAKFHLLWTPVGLADHRAVPPAWWNPR